MWFALLSKKKNPIRRLGGFQLLKVISVQVESFRERSLLVNNFYCFSFSRGENSSYGLFFSFSLYFTFLKLIN
jgi:hypothetical protein